MPKIVGVRFKKAGKIYYFDPANLQNLQVGDQVIVETSRGYEAGEVATAPRDASDGEVIGQLKPVVRRATVEDMLSKQDYAMREAAALQRCREKVSEYNLPMKVIGAEYGFDGSSLVFFFTAEKRIDFRELVKELAHMFRTRIELRQIGARDEAKLIGGIGPCGRPLCCMTHLTEFAPVSIKMAKQQDLPLSPMEISGLCGRLLCCLAYEDEYYREAKRKAPKAGEIVDTDYGEGKVLGVNVIKQTVTVAMDSEVTIEIPWTEQEETAEEKPTLEEPGARQRSRRRRSSRRQSERPDSKET